VVKRRKSAAGVCKTSVWLPGLLSTSHTAASDLVSTPPACGMVIWRFWMASHYPPKIKVARGDL